MLCLLSGANWSDGSNAGVWASNWNNARNSSNDNVGFRSDSIPQHPDTHEVILETREIISCFKRNRCVTNPLVVLDENWLVFYETF